jgi:hypothetical protein
MRVPASALVPLLVALPCAPPTARAEGPAPTVTVASGTGLSLGNGAADTVGKRSPVFLEFDVGLSFEELPTLEWTPGLLVELEGRVALGFNPSLKRILDLGRGSLYAGVGVPLFFSPFTLVGVEAAVGGFLRLWRMLAANVELRTHVFFAGSDLPDDGLVAKIDLAVGVRLDI